MLDSFAQKFAASILPLSLSLGTALDLGHIISTLPSHDQAKILLEFYVTKVNWLYHIIHVPTVRKMLDQIYEDLHNKRLPPYSHLALTCAIFALSAYFSPGPLAGMGRNELHSCSFRNWSSLAQDSLSASHYITSPAIESLQAFILVSMIFHGNLRRDTDNVVSYHTIFYQILEQAQCLVL